MLMQLEQRDISEIGTVPHALQGIVSYERAAEMHYESALCDRPIQRSADMPDFSEMTDQRVLEMILSSVLPVKETGALAKCLLARFGDLSRVIAAPVARLSLVDGLGDAAICQLKLAELCATRMARARILARPVISSSQDLLTYCHTCLAHRETEQLRVLYLDRKNGLIADEIAADGTVDHVPVYPREILRRALELNASALILIHNHPSGDPSPSQSDISMTEAIRSAGETLSITLHDHLIIGASREFSFRSEGFL